jgi:hypothetical protein
LYPFLVRSHLSFANRLVFSEPTCPF